eukprot:CAMPEP_0178446422 /NCGR_PEP_ID=MMETSP0689_2-20121128/40794_1 /TAXON_ID=160604 /ORGANISM="Amphidinium massartii, Strain CS-259" /LENGTH=444 /DNA_ID=CAMNT_0020071243 /DNA_START=90 /DNA_END=1424 /DNA_ORIENTATION=-
MFVIVAFFAIVRSSVACSSNSCIEDDELAATNLIVKQVAKVRSQTPVLQADFESDATIVAAVKASGEVWDAQLHDDLLDEEQILEERVLISNVSGAANVSNMSNVSNVTNVTNVTNASAAGSEEEDEDEDDVNEDDDEDDDDTTTTKEPFSTTTWGIPAWVFQLQKVQPRPQSFARSHRVASILERVIDIARQQQLQEQSQDKTSATEDSLAELMPMIPSEVLQVMGTLSRDNAKHLAAVPRDVMDLVVTVLQTLKEVEPAVAQTFHEQSHETQHFDIHTAVAMLDAVARRVRSHRMQVAGEEIGGQDDVLEQLLPLLPDESQEAIANLSPEDLSAVESVPEPVLELVISILSAEDIFTHGSNELQQKMEAAAARHRQQVLYGELESEETYDILDARNGSNDTNVTNVTNVTIGNVTVPDNSSNASLIWQGFDLSRLSLAGLQL